MFKSYEEMIWPAVVSPGHYKMEEECGFCRLLESDLVFWLSVRYGAGRGGFSLTSPRRFAGRGGYI